MNLREKVYDNFRSAIDVIIHQNSDVLVHAGDLFDVVKPKTRVYTPVPEASTAPTIFNIPRHIIPIQGKTMARILVAYASKKGSTAEIAQAIGREMQAGGHTLTSWRWEA